MIATSASASPSPSICSLSICPSLPIYLFLPLPLFIARSSFFLFFGCHAGVSYHLTVCGQGCQNFIVVVESLNILTKIVGIFGKEGVDYLGRGSTWIHQADVSIQDRPSDALAYKVRIIGRGLV